MSSTFCRRRRGKRQPTAWITALAGVMMAQMGAGAAEQMLQVSSLNPRVGELVEVRLHLPSGDGWDRANIGQFVIRSGGAQRSIPIEPNAGDDFLTLKTDEPGYALLVLSAGPALEADQSDSWQRTPYCSKAVLRVDPADDRGPRAELVPGGDAGVVGKVGQKLEILPLMNPAALRVGDDLPVRVYYEGDKLQGVSVEAACRQAGAPPPVVKTTDSVGTTWFPITRAGRWVVRFEHVVEEVTYAAELIFDVYAADDSDGRPANAPSGGGR